MLWVSRRHVVMLSLYIYIKSLLFVNSIRRYDTLHHELTDYGFNDATREVFPGQDYSNPRIKDFQKGIQSTKTCLLTMT